MSWWDGGLGGAQLAWGPPDGQGTQVMTLLAMAWSAEEQPGSLAEAVTLSHCMVGFSNRMHVGRFFLNANVYAVQPSFALAYAASLLLVHAAAQSASAAVALSVVDERGFPAKPASGVGASTYSRTRSGASGHSSVAGTSSCVLMMARACTQGWVGGETGRGVGRNCT